MNLHFLIAGDIKTLSSCYIYNRRIIEGLSTKGHNLTVHSLHKNFPFPSNESLEQCNQVMKSIPKNEIIVIDSLVLGAIPSILKNVYQKNPIVGLIHLPISVDPNFTTYQRTMISSSEHEALNFAKRFVTTSDYTAEILWSLNIDTQKVDVVIPGLDKFTLKTNYPERPYRLLSIANLCRTRDHSILVKALSALKDKKWTLDCYGNFDQDSEFLSDFQAMIRHGHLQDKIQIHGTIEGEALSQAYRNADLFVHPSDFEIYGMVLVEALAHGIPVVASTGGGICRTVPPKMGHFFKPGDVYGFQSILDELLENKEIYKKLYTQAATYKDQAQPWSKSIDLFEDALKKVM